MFSYNKEEFGELHWCSYWLWMKIHIIVKIYLTYQLLYLELNSTP